MDLCGKVYDAFVCFKFNIPETTPAESDNVYEYSLQLLQLGCFYFKFADAIREGDGGRVLRCWKYMIPIFSASPIMPVKLQICYCNTLTHCLQDLHHSCYGAAS